jgi:hypothetical protein
MTIDRTNGTVFVYGYVTQSFAGSVVTCDLRNGKEKATYEFLKCQIAITYILNEHALIELPKFFVPIFNLERLVLTPKQISIYLGIALCHNAAYLKPTPERKIETVGGIRI